MIINALKPYHEIRMLDTVFEASNINGMDTIQNLSTKVLYSNIINQKTLPPKTTRMWGEEFNTEIEWASIAKTKCINNLK